jgi:hypothetical protein
MKKTKTDDVQEAMARKRHNKLTTSTTIKVYCTIEVKKASKKENVARMSSDTANFLG